MGRLLPVANPTPCSLKLASLRSVHALVWNPRLNRRLDAGAKMTEKEGDSSARSTFSLLILVLFLLGSVVRGVRHEY